MKITKRQLRKILKEEEYDSFKDARHTGGGREVGGSYQDVWEAGYRDALDGIDRNPKHEGDDRYEAGYEMGQNEMADIHGGISETKKGVKMKITKRQLKQIINEAIGGLSAKDQTPFIETVMASLEAGDPHAAAQAVMDSYWIDDTFIEEEDALVDILGGLPYGASIEQVEMAAEAWLNSYRAGELRP